MNPLRELQKHGQAVWLDYIRRNLITTGELERLVKEDGVRGITSNPTIFEKAISGGTEYDEALTGLIAKRPQASTGELFEALAIEDIRMAADVLRAVYDESEGADGFVSLEVSPHLAYDTDGSIAEARRLWKAVDRPNILIKVPGTRAGLPAIETLLGEGVNVNITLMFSLDHYDAVAHAFLRGADRTSNPRRIASVASFFVSRVDTMVDKALEKVGTPEALALRGKIAVANSKIVYQRFREIFYGEPFAALRRRGARVQRPLWASTSTKNPAYRDVIYVEELIGRDTVNTMPPATIESFRDHGQIRGDTVEERVEEARAEVAGLKDLGVSLEAVTEQLQTDGVGLFAASFDQLLEALEQKTRAMAGA